jgi:hypothetical protein
MHFICGFCSENTSAIAVYGRWFPGQREFLINIFSCQFTDICEKLAWFAPYFHKNVSADKMRESLLPWLKVVCTRVLAISSQFVSLMSAWWALNFKGLYPYHICCIQHADLLVCDIRLQFCM